MGFAMAAVVGRALSLGCVVILAIETSVEQVGAALVDHSGVVAHASVSSDRRHAESLVPLIRFVTDQAGVSLSSVSAVAVDVGPGLFTGMRVGIATAQSLAWALDVPVAPVCSLDALGHRMRECDDLVAAALDARRSEVYWALYRSRGTDSLPQRITEPVVGSPEDLAIHLADRAEPVLCVGTGFVRHRESFEPLTMARFAGVETRFPDAASVGRVALSMVANDETVGPDAVVPMYLRPPDADIQWKTREGSS